MSERRILKLFETNGRGQSGLAAALPGALAAAELTERVCCGMELDPKYVDVVVQRWQDLSGKKATLEAEGRSFEEIADDRRRAA
jgi:hypothetical protein